MFNPSGAKGVIKSEAAVKEWAVQSKIRDFSESPNFFALRRVMNRPTINQFTYNLKVDNLLDEGENRLNVENGFRR